MWIRTQGKSCLIKCNIINVEIGEQSDDYLIRTLLDNGRTFILACYKSEERALEVLDEIQKIVSPNFNFNGSNEEADLFVKTQILNCMIRFYQMPEV